ncbi:hypothetical protein MIR68_003959 [Amoeboaphelidium protococcarum]|nr:hypothetical protein MIR68_003959 [Amoeboaphelidium protococcarum]
MWAIVIAYLQLANVITAGVDFTIRGTNTVGITKEDSKGNFYISQNVGKLNEEIYSANGSFVLTQVYQSGVDSYIAKYDKYGALQWHLMMTGALYGDFIYFLDVDPFDNVIAVIWEQSNDFKIYSPTNQVAKTIPKSGGSQAVIAKFSVNGTLLRTARLDAASSWNVPQNSVMGPNGQILVHVWNEVVDFPTNPVVYYDNNNVAGPSSSGSGHRFMLDNNLNLVYFHDDNTFSVDVSMRISANGDQFLQMNQQTAVSLTDSTGRLISAPFVGGVDCPLLVFNSTGAFQYYWRFAGVGDETPGGVSFDKSGAAYASVFANGPFIAYNASNTTVMTLGEAGVSGSYVFKLNGEGSILKWSTISGSAAVKLSLAFDANDNMVFSGVSAASAISFNNTGAVTNQYMHPFAGQYAIIMVFEKTGSFFNQTILYTSSQSVTLQQSFVFANRSFLIAFQTSGSSVNIIEDSGTTTNVAFAQGVAKLNNLLPMVVTTTTTTTTTTSTTTTTTTTTTSTTTTTTPTATLSSTFAQLSTVSYGSVGDGPVLLSAATQSIASAQSQSATTTFTSTVRPLTSILSSTQKASSSSAKLLTTTSSHVVTQTNGLITFSLGEFYGSFSSLSTNANENIQNQSGPQALQSQSSMISAVAAIVSGVFVVAMMFVGLYARHKFRRANNLNPQMTKANTYTHGSIASSAAATTVMQMKGTQMQGGTTLLSTSFEISVPGFLNLSEGENFRKVPNSQLNAGAQGSIWLVQILSTPSDHPLRQCEGQIMVAKYTSNKANSQAFLQEVALMWRFKDCAHIAKMAGFDAENLVMLMFYYQNGSLDDLICMRNVLSQQVDWNFDLIKSLAIDVFSAMVVLHLAGVVHNDIKASNYLVDTQSGQVRICLTDFGICTLLGTSKTVTGLNWNALFGSTPSYAAPEVWMNQLVSDDMKPKRDVFAGAVILAQLLNRQKAWMGFTKEQIREVVCAGGRVQIQETVRDPRSDRYRQIIEMAWDQNMFTRVHAQRVLDDLINLY